MCRTQPGRLRSARPRPKGDRDADRHAQSGGSLVTLTVGSPASRHGRSRFPRPRRARWPFGTPRRRRETCTSRSVTRSRRASSRRATTHSGYAEQVFQLEQAANPDLQACQARLSRRAHEHDRPPASSVSLRRGHAARSGRRRAGGARTLRSSRSRSVPTICSRCFRFGQGVFDQTCVDERLPKVADRLRLDRRDTSVGAIPNAPIVGMTYFDPLLALWTAPGFPHDLVVANADVWHAINETLAQTYAGLGVPVADVEGGVLLVGLRHHRAHARLRRPSAERCAGVPVVLHVRDPRG